MKHPQRLATVCTLITNAVKYHDELIHQAIPGTQDARVLWCSARRRVIDNHKQTQANLPRQMSGPRQLMLDCLPLGKRNLRRLEECLASPEQNASSALPLGENFLLVASYLVEDQIIPRNIVPGTVLFPNGGKGRRLFGFQ